MEASGGAGIRAAVSAADPRGPERPFFRARAWAPVPARAGGKRGAPLWEPLDFDFRPGDRVLLDGPSGCGKSTFLLALAGLLESQRAWTETGTLERPAGRRGGYLFQNPADRFCAVRAEDELAFGLENQALSPEEIDRRIALAAREFGLADLLGRRINQLSGGEQQRLALASLWAEDPSVLFIDEAMSQLDAAGRRVLLGAFDRWSAAHPEGIAVCVDHRADLWENRFGRVLRWTGAGWRERTPGERRPAPRAARPTGDRAPPLGQARSAAPAAATTRSAPSGSALSRSAPSPAGPSAFVPPAAPAAVCESLRLALPDGRPLGGGHEAIDAAFRPGRVAVVAGPNGSGKSTLLKTIAGLISPYAGAVRHGDLAVRKAPKKTAEWKALGARVSMALQNPELQFGAGLVRDHDPAPPEFLGLAHALDKSPFELSLGQQRRLSLSMLRPDRPLLLLDEPFYGQDRGNTRVLIDYIRARAAAGTAVVLVCHDEDLSQALADDLYFWDGKRLAPGARVSYRAWWEEAE